MSKAETRIAYTGPALEDGVMDVRELAPALLALGELCNRANEVLTGQEKRVSVQVKSDFKAGSFEFSVLVDVWKPVSEFLTGRDYLAAKEVLFLLGIAGVGGGGAVGLFALVKKLRGRKPEAVLELDEEKVSVSTEDGESIVVEKRVMRLYETPAVRRAVKKMVAPLDGDGVDGLEVRDPKNREVVERIEKDESPYFAEIPDLGEVVENVTDILLQPVTVHLEGKQQWVFRRGEGGETMSAKILDEEFAVKVANGEVRFASGDVILARVRERQWEEGGALKTKYEVVKVLKYPEASRDSALHIAANGGAAA